ncbi:preprotein translocase subunit SecD [Halorubrum ezzemoulense]|uniref:Protein-export membrane protein SecD n=1 Tax=Halorubrum ezzemoulense TaxID=337243 RepID=A0ABT4Z188_HALEZ|nr:preprotein translocase subunit SecD [Halorubrum ezzemoulense]MDB2243680.1 preprotein translocase subunit SecD [Halorubrum ezzemoulense]MDB2251746.1 preprotein translocase subunit SecD [Halorubrum ezzemoulense]MDB2277416.1 preprotein translocase subunit SecD [Halorubrum ezzemoulense]MDB2284126.1 preprotein translocase subunit SecD [Halorubrum ezzemoulense]MDB2289043.1 preprotein translocase subunit SecD [Halorubrum ezzemoulense]
MLEPIKKNWRILLLVVVVIGSSVALFAPGFGPEPAPGENVSEAQQGVTNLQYGLDLAGGTRVRAPLSGYTATDVVFGGDTPESVADAVAAELDNASVRNVGVVPEEGAVEVTKPSVTESQFRTAMDAAGYEYAEVRSGVTQETRDETMNVIQGKINEAGLSGGSVQQIQSITGEYFILVEVPGQGRQEVIDLLEERGTVRIDIAYPDGNGTAVQEGTLTQGDFETIGTAAQSDRGTGAYVPVTVRNTAESGQSPAHSFQDAVAQRGFADAYQTGADRCGYNEETGEIENSNPCLLLVVDGEVVNSFGMDPGLADSMAAGSWADTGNFRLTTGEFAEAQTISLNLRAGALPADLDISGEGTSSSISASQGENFRTYSLVIGVLSVLAVAGMVFLRYREPRVALPMIVTALTEVYALLGFAALLGYPLELAVIAGFIAVVGTGVDDLVIIADEVMSEGDVNSKKVFDSRFRRAFWVIGAAAATTIIAMSPLMVLSLGDLSGFAIFTVLGVLVGVLITRPAYGDILRRLLTVK